MSTPIDVARVSALGRLWAKVKLFHPYLVTRDIDWDAALVSALRKVRSAETAAQYRAAVDEMLAALGDPETHASIQTTRREELDSAVAKRPPSDDHAASAAPRYFRHDVRHPDGRQLQRVGIQPHIRVEPTILGIREGRDEVLEAAVRYLQKRA